MLKCNSNNTFAYLKKLMVVGLEMTCFTGISLLFNWISPFLALSLSQTSMATSLSVSEDLIYCGCADGTVRAFSPTDLHFICTLPHPHSLGTDVSTVTDAR